MQSLEKRISELESRTNIEQRVLVQMPRDDGTYEAAPDGFQGQVFKVVFVDSPNALNKPPHADT